MKKDLTFADRSQAGKELARRLATMHLADPVVLAMPRGGVPVAVEVARRLGAPLDLVHVRKIGTPFNPEIAAAAVVNGDAPEVVINQRIVEEVAMTVGQIEEAAAKELAEIARRRRLYGKSCASLPLRGRTIVLVDDGIATGASVRAALKALGRKRPSELILAVPVAPPDTLATLRPLVDDIVCLETPEPFYAIGHYYRDFHQVPDEEVVRLLGTVDRRSNDNEFSSD